MSPAPEPESPPTIGYILKMFPRLSETFILNEVLELERQGLRLRIFSLKKPIETVRHRRTAAVRSPVCYLPEKILRAPWHVIQGQLYAALRHRKAWRHGLRNAVRHVRASGDSTALTAFCQACCVVRGLRGIRHVHAHYANVPAKIALLVQRLAGVSFSVTTHAKDIFQHEPLASPKLRERLSRARFLVANSQFSSGYLAKNLGTATPIHTIYNGLDLEAFPLRQQEPDTPVILSVGRLVEKKGFLDLVAACALLKERGVRFSCELVGTGPLSGALKERIRQADLNDRVKLLGPMPQEALQRQYARATVFALPCVVGADGDRDILPNVLKEAMASGVPVVTTRLEGIEELITDEQSGLLLEPGDTAGLAARLERVLLDAALQKRLAAAGRRVIEERFARQANFSTLKTLLLQAAVAPETRVAPETSAEFQTYGTHCVR